MSRLRNIPEPLLRGIAARVAGSVPRKPRLDWREYYLQFEQRHGGDPVVHEGLVLFRDGWRYSATDHAGPEYPPPEDEGHLRALQIAYWDIRRQQLRQVYHQLSVRANGLRSLQEMKDGPLVETVRYPDDDGRSVRESAPVDLDVIQADADYSKSQMDECVEMIKELRGETDAPEEE